jgi:hypothetical protein
VEVRTLKRREARRDAGRLRQFQARGRRKFGVLLPAGEEGRLR